MATVSLSPWPARTATASLAAAIRVLGEAIGEDDDTVTARVGATASALVERYAPGAPDVVRDEAAIRVAGWLREAPSYGARSESEGEISTSFSPSMTSALRASGAMAMLSPWKVRRAGVVA